MMKKKRTVKSIMKTIAEKADITSKKITTRDAELTMTTITNKKVVLRLTKRTESILEIYLTA